MRSVALFIVALLFAAPGRAAARGAEDEPVVVAFPRVHGSRAQGRRATGRGVIAGIEAAGLRVRRGRPLQGAAEVLGGTVYDVEVARVADCDFLLIVRLRRRGRGLVAAARLLRTADGSEVETFRAPYRSRRRARRNGKALGRRIARAARADLEARRRASRAPPSAGEAPPKARPTDEEVAGRADAETPAQGARRPPTQDPSPPSASTTATPPTSAAGPERAGLRFALGAGSRVYAAYSVVTGGTPTGLGYTLDPLFATEARAVVEMPFAPVGLEADFGFRPVRFSLSTEPALVPPDPSGQLVNVGGGLWWRIDVARLGPATRFTFAPLASVDYAALLVEDQGQNTIVSSWSSVTLGGGLRLGLEVGRDFALEVEGEGGAVLGYSESPAATGRDPSGFRVGVRARLRLWLTSFLGAQLAAGYDYQSMRFVGPATRAVFEGDPPLMDAEVLTEGVDVTLAAVLALF
jgi:hypothetical protein